MEIIVNKQVELNEIELCAELSELDCSNLRDLCMDTHG